MTYTDSLQTFGNMTMIVTSGVENLTLAESKAPSQDLGCKSWCFILLAQIACKCSWISTCCIFFSGGTTSQHPSTFMDCETSSNCNPKVQSYLHWEFSRSHIIRNGWTIPLSK